MELDYDGGGLGKGAAVTLYIDGDEVGEGRLPATVPLIFSGTRPPTWAGHGLAGQRRLHVRGEHVLGQGAGCSSTSAKTPRTSTT